MGKKKKNEVMADKLTHTEKFKMQAEAGHYGRISSDDASQFASEMSMQQWKEVCARLRASNPKFERQQMIDVKDVAEYCLKYNILPDKSSSTQPEFDFYDKSKSKYTSLIEGEEITEGGETCFVVVNDTENKVLTIESFETKEMKEIKY